MEFKKVAKYLEGVPYTQKERGKLLYNHIINQKAQNCLELGFAHGVASCYIAAALHENGIGKLDCVDLESSEKLSPNLEKLTMDTGLTEYVKVHREKNSYTWYLKKVIEENSRNYQCTPQYDFVFIDGSKNWTIDGFAFYLVDKLLKEKGFVLFDDFKWRYIEYSKDILDGISIRDMSEDQIDQPNIELVFKLLVMQHPHYSNFIIDEDWAWAQKTLSEKKRIQIIATQSFKYRILKKLRSLKSL